MSKPHPIYITEVKNISPLIQLLEQTAKRQYEIKALADNHVKQTRKNGQLLHIMENKGEN
jgi:hypothetical protein